MVLTGTQNYMGTCLMILTDGSHDPTTPWAEVSLTRSPAAYIIPWPRIILTQLILILKFLGPNLEPVEVPRLGVQSELQLLAYAGSEQHLQPTPQPTAPRDP